MASMSLKLLFKEQNMTCIGQHAPLLKVELFSKFLMEFHHGLEHDLPSHQRPNTVKHITIESSFACTALKTILPRLAWTHGPDTDSAVSR